jgi:hypothetical protein
MSGRMSTGFRRPSKVYQRSDVAFIAALRAFLGLDPLPSYFTRGSPTQRRAAWRVKRAKVAA